MLYYIVLIISTVIFYFGIYTNTISDLGCCGFVSKFPISKFGTIKKDIIKYESYKILKEELKTIEKYTNILYGSVNVKRNFEAFPKNKKSILISNLSHGLVNEKYVLKFTVDTNKKFTIVNNDNEEIDDDITVKFYNEEKVDKIKETIELDLTLYFKIVHDGIIDFSRLDDLLLKSYEESKYNHYNEKDDTLSTIFKFFKILYSGEEMNKDKLLEVNYDDIVVDEVTAI